LDYSAWESNSQQHKLIFTVPGCLPQSINFVKIDLPILSSYTRLIFLLGSVFVMKEWYRINSEKVLADLGSQKSGLTSIEAGVRLIKYGPNVLEKKRKPLKS
jgi:hypothetical protein